MSKPIRPHVYLTGALKLLYGQRLGEARDLFADHERLNAELAALATVLRMFDPGIDLAAIRPIRPYKPRRTRWARTALKN